MAGSTAAAAPPQVRGGLGLTIAVVSALCFGTSGAFAASLIGAGWSPGAAVIARLGGAALLLTVPAVWQLRGQWHLLRRNARTILAFGLVAVAGCQLFFFNAVERLSVGVALLLEYLGLLLVVGWLWVRHGRRPRRLTIAGAATAVLGLALVLDLAGAQIDFVGVFWGLAAAVGLAVYFVVSARTEDSLPPIVLAWAGIVTGVLTLGVLGAVGIVPLRATTGSVQFAGHDVSWLVPVLGLCLVSTVIAYAVGIAATRMLGAKLASFVGLTEVMFAVLFAWLLLGQMPTGIQLVGGTLITAGVALARLDELRESGRSEPRREVPIARSTPA